MPSPCGVNCSYTVEFDGPYLKCASSTKENMTYHYDDEFPHIYRGSWVASSNSISFSDTALAKYSDYYFETTTLVQPSAYDEYNSTLVVTSEYLFCRPFRALYTVHVDYMNNVQNLSLSTKPIEQLVNLEPNNGGDNFTLVPGFSMSKSGPVSYGNLPAKKSDISSSHHFSPTTMKFFAIASLIALVHPSPFTS